MLKEIIAVTILFLVFLGISFFIGITTITEKHIEIKRPILFILTLCLFFVLLICTYYKDGKK